jgi:hypothetical protein
LEIADLLINIVSEINKFIDLLYPKTFPFNTSYYCNDFENYRSTVTFNRLSALQMNTIMNLPIDSIKLFNIRQDYSQLMTPVRNQTMGIIFDNIYSYSFEVWDKLQLFLHQT